MALNPFQAFDIFEDPFFHHGMEPRFGMGIMPHDFSSHRILPRQGNHHLMTGYRRPWQLAREAVGELAKDQKNLHFGKDGFQACVDVHHFAPSEITVKTVDHTVTIEGKHEEREDGHGSVQRHFVPPPPAIEGASERHIPITHTNAPAHLSVKHNKKHIDDQPKEDGEASNGN
ncbi:unnamed protein product [Chironomus riparius]|uniref:SHSP domain-containing protein n=1 Tax=Chironomus riparius TaxID=315576 RepID=A0A9P0J0C3_9DIPT|nr:unnamed protein product [Chironomus riparius]